MKTKVQWVSDDNLTFQSKEDCELHEKVVCPITGILQTYMKNQGIVLNPDNCVKLFSGVLVSKSEEIRPLLAKVGGIKARKSRGKAV